jgi:thiamine ABC transporter ATP-binding protein
MLEIKDIQFSYPGRSFHFDFKIERGSFVAIIGPSGGGKSTLLHLIAGFETPKSGSISFEGEALTQRPPAKRPLTIIFQDNNLFPHLTVQENVGLGLSPSLSLTNEDVDRITAALSKVSLMDLANKKPGALSGGERQRVAIARALLRNKPLLLLDEAFAALGPALRNDMLQLIKRLHVEQHLTTLMVTHLPDDARTVASHIAFIADGGVKAYGPVKTILKSSNTELQTYLGESH